MIGLLDIDNFEKKNISFPNLALMKLSSYYKSKGYKVEWFNPLTRYEKVYVSKVFSTTYRKDFSYPILADEIIKGGTGYNNNVLPTEVEHCYPDYSLYEKLTENTAYGFLSRGCPRKCPFCIVGEKEGLTSKKVADLAEFWNGQKYIKLLDPNLLACDKHLDLLQQLAKSKAYIDFTQGIDARLITDKNIDILSKIRVKCIYFAFDLLANEKIITEGLKMYKAATNIQENKTGVYILTNYNTTHEEDLYRVNIVQNLGYRPYIMVYDKPNAPKITKDLQRWSNNRIIYYGSKMNFNNYNRRDFIETKKL